MNKSRTWLIVKCCKMIRKGRFLSITFVINIVYLLVRL